LTVCLSVYPQSEYKSIFWICTACGEVIEISDDDDDDDLVAAANAVDPVDVCPNVSDGPTVQPRSVRYIYEPSYDLKRQQVIKEILNGAL